MVTSCRINWDRGGCVHSLETELVQFDVPVWWIMCAV